MKCFWPKCTYFYCFCCEIVIKSAKVDVINTEETKIDVDSQEIIFKSKKIESAVNG